VFQTKPSLRFLESWRRISNCVCGFSEEIYLYYKLLGYTLMLLKNILREPQTQVPILLREMRTQLPILLGDSMNLREGFTSKQCFSEKLLNKNPWKLENHRLSWQSVSKVIRILRMSGLKRIKTSNGCLKSREHLWNLKTRSGLYSGLNISIQDKKKLKISDDIPFKLDWEHMTRHQVAPYGCPPCMRDIAFHVKGPIYIFFYKKAATLYILGNCALTLR
jgi:hypothetical protein